MKKGKNPEQTKRFNVFTQIRQKDIKKEISDIKKEIGKICLEDENTERKKKWKRETELYGKGLCQARALKIDVCQSKWVELGEAEDISSKVS